jgi:uncharacterized membrane protein YfcA
MQVSEAIIIFLAGTGAGAINAVAGGGTLLSFPVLLWLGRDPIIANASNAVALWPGSLASVIGFRRELAAAPRLLRWLLPPSLLGGALGGYLLLETPTRVFTALVPFLILGATLLIALKRPLMALRRPPTTLVAETGSPASVAAEAPAVRPLALALVQLAVAVYGGYFGAAMGIMMLATFSLCGIEDIHQRNGLKNAAATLINAVAGVVFVLRGAVDWADAGVLGAGAIVGGYLGAHFGRRLPARAAEWVVVAIGVAAAVVQLVRR